MRRKIYAQLIGTALIVCFLLGMVPLSAAAAGADSYAPDMNKWGAQDNNGWYYQYKSTGGNYQELTYYDAGAAISWQRDAFAFDPGAMNEMLFINRSSFFLGENGSRPVYMFKVPFGGKVRLSYETHGQSDMGLKVSLNRTPLQTVQFNTNGYTGHTLDITVKKGDKIYLEGFSSGQNREGWVRNYSVSFLSVDSDSGSAVYEADTEYGWGEQDNNGWFYFYQDLLTGEYNPMPFIAVGDETARFTDRFSADQLFPFCFVGRKTVHPAVNANAVKAFRAPESGSVVLQVQAKRSGADTPGSPSLLRIYRGGEQIFPADGTAYELHHNGGAWQTISVPTELAEGEYLYIVLGCNGSNINGEVQMTESVSYTAVHAVAAENDLAMPVYEGFTIRDNPKNHARKDMRFVFSLDRSKYDALLDGSTFKLTEIGFIYQTAENLGDRELTGSNGISERITYLDGSQLGRLQMNVQISDIVNSEQIFFVRTYLTVSNGETTRTYYGDTVRASVRDYLASADPGYRIKTVPVTFDLSKGTAASDCGTIMVQPAYVAKAAWHQTRNVQTSVTEGSTSYAYVSGGVLQTTAASLSNGGISLTQSASVLSGGIGGIGMDISFSMDYDVILPAYGGIRLTKESPYVAPFPTDGPRQYLSYPIEWDAQMFLIQGKTGGWLVYHDDDGSQFKRIWLSNNGTDFRFTIETVPQAPYSAYTSFSARPWNIVAYEGDWTVGAEIYKEFADKKFNMSAIQDSKPDWADEVQSVVLTDLNVSTMPMLRELAKQTDASRTLLIVPGWRSNLYDVNYPDYTPIPGLKRFIDEAHELGYRIFLHANLIGCDDGISDYTNYGLEDDRYLNDLTGQPIMESWTSSYSVSFWLINPASRDWQDLLIARLVEAYQTLGVDGFHLDQSLLAYNDNRGLVNGMTSMQGVVELERRLAEALPGCLFSGEGTNEFNCRYASFLQRAPYGINSATGQSWSDEKIQQIVPLDTLLWSDTVRLYHYPAMPTSASEDAYNAWCRAGIRLGALPTLMRSSAYELMTQNLATQQALSLFRWYQENCMFVNYTRWDGDSEVIRYRTVTGNTIEIRKEELW